jgi:acetyltransferase-like isoleucine patch superfamily enzyme
MTLYRPPYMRDELAWAVQRGTAEIGDYSYGAPAIRYVALGLRFVCGKYCSFGPDVQVMLASNHRHDWVSTYPFPAFADEWPSAAGLSGHVAGRGDVVVGNDVWVGAGAMLGSGVTVGDGAVIAARSVVVKDVPPYAIVGGNPARVIRYRFDEATVADLMRLRWWDWAHERVEANIPLLLSGDIGAFIEANTPRPPPPPSPDADPRVQAALATLHRTREDALASSPLVAMPVWVARGEAPPAERLRAKGFTAAPAEAGKAAAERAYHAGLARRPFVARWGFSIPCAEAVAALRALGPLLEIGCGTGYWTALLRNAGHDTIATDAEPLGGEVYGLSVGRHCEALEASAVEAVARFPDRDVFCSWPTQGASWALGAAWRLQPGRAFALVGDGPDGVIGSRGLYRYLATRFDKIAEAELPQFPGVRDRLTIHRKRPAGEA